VHVRSGDAADEQRLQPVAACVCWRHLPRQPWACAPALCGYGDEGQGRKRAEHDQRKGVRSPAVQHKGGTAGESSSSSSAVNHQGTSAGKSSSCSPTAALAQPAASIRSLSLSLSLSHTHTLTQVYIYITLNTHTHTHIHTHTHSHTSIYIHRYIYTHGIHTCMSVCLSVCLYVCIYLCMHACIRMYIFVYLRIVCMYVKTYACMYVHTHKYTHINVCMCVCARACVRVGCHDDGASSSPGINRGDSPAPSGARGGARFARAGAQICAGDREVCRHRWASRGDHVLGDACRGYGAQFLKKYSLLRLYIVNILWY
jgi:hypothetical protein